MKPYICLLQWGDTVLHVACSFDHHDLALLLINAGMSVDVRNGVSILSYIFMYACTYVCMYV